MLAGQRVQADATMAGEVARRFNRRHHFQSPFLKYDSLEDYPSHGFWETGASTKAAVERVVEAGSPTSG